MIACTRAPVAAMLRSTSAKSPWTNRVSLVAAAAKRS